MVCVCVCKRQIWLRGTTWRLQHQASLPLTLTVAPHLSHKHTHMCAHTTVHTQIHTHSQRGGSHVISPALPMKLLVSLSHFCKDSRPGIDLLDYSGHSCQQQPPHTHTPPMAATAHDYNKALGITTKTISTENNDLLCSRWFKTKWEIFNSNCYPWEIWVDTTP